MNNFRLTTKLTFQLKQKIKFTKLKPTIDIAIVPLYKQQFHFMHQNIVMILTRYLSVYISLTPELIKSHDSESRGQGCTRQMSVLFTHSTTLRCH